MVLRQTAPLDADSDSGSGTSKMLCYPLPCPSLATQFQRFLRIPFRLVVVALICCGYPSNSKCFQDSVWRNSVFVRDLIKGPSLLAQFRAFIARPFSSAHKVNALMLSGGDNLKVLQRVVEPVMIFVMNMLGRKKFTPEMDFHDVSMLKDLLALPVHFHSYEAIPC